MSLRDYLHSFPIFRYDNARHKPDLGFIGHKHLNGGTVIKCAAPDISDVIDALRKKKAMAIGKIGETDIHVETCPMTNGKTIA